jgi:hypothetical protein
VGKVADGLGKVAGDMSAVTAFSPSAPAAGDAGVRHDADVRLLRRCLQAILIGAIPLQRFGFQIGGSEISLGLAITLVALAVLTIRRVVRIDPWRLALLALSVATLSVSVMLNSATSSLPSFMLFVAIYLTLAFVTATGKDFYRDIVRTFLNLVLVCAALGTVQFVVQFVASPSWLFTFKGVLPDGVLMHAFNTAVPLSYGATTFKSNGFLLLEPSMFSQYLALALLLELLLFKRWWRLAAYAAPLPLSFSGTGLLLLAVFLPLVVLHLRAYRYVLGGFVLAIVAVALGDLWHMDQLVARLGELNSTQTSGFARFLSPVWLLRDWVYDSLSGLLFGLGPGSITDALKQMPYEAFDPTWGKLLFEYGLVGTLAFSIFFIACLFTSAHSRWVSGFLLFSYVLLGGMLLDPRMNALILVFGTLQRPQAVSGPTPGQLR